MTTKQKQLYTIITAVIIVAVGAGIFFQAKKGVKEEPSSTLQTEAEKIQKTSTEQKVLEKEGLWTGVLKKSDNEKKGNLMLVTKEHTIYLRTSRDFSQLIGKEVYATYEGTLDSFVLGNIAEKKAD